MIRKHVDGRRFESDVQYTKAPHHATELAGDAAREGIDIVIAVGGDGSVNETAAGLKDSGTALSIIPTGSGNGLARHLGMPLSLEAALHGLVDYQEFSIDTFMVNDRFGVGTFGMGFDAHIAHLFAQAGTRGYATYVKLVLSEFYKYQPREYQFTVNGHPHSKEAFLFTIANSSQFGNNAVIAPFADLTDGLLDIAMLRQFPLYSAPHLIYRLTHNSLHKSKFYDMLRGSEIRIRNHGDLPGHIDGEPLLLQGEVRINLVPSSLRVFAPSPKP